MGECQGSEDIGVPDAADRTQGRVRGQVQHVRYFIKLGRSQFLMGGQVDHMGRFVQPGVVQCAGIGQITADDLARSERAFEARGIEKAADRLSDAGRGRTGCFTSDEQQHAAGGLRLQQLRERRSADETLAPVNKMVGFVIAAAESSWSERSRPALIFIPRR